MHGTIPSTIDTAVNKIYKNLCPHGASIQVILLISPWCIYAAYFLGIGTSVLA